MAKEPMASPNIHPTAIISPEAQIADDVHIGPYAIIGAGVAIGKGTIVGAHSCVDGITLLGENNRIGRFAAIGADPQDLTYKGEECKLVVGDGNFFGDYAQICRGTHKSPDRTTRIGNNNFIMAYVHVGHDCIFGDSNVIANAVQFAGHVEIEDHVHIGGSAAVHQFCHIGRYAMVSGMAAVTGHVPPYVRVSVDPDHARGLNQVGLRRSQEFSSEETADIKRAYRLFFYGPDGLKESVAQVREKWGANPHVEYFCAFIDRMAEGTAKTRPIVKGGKRGPVEE